MATYKIDGDLEVTGGVSFIPNFAVSNTIMHGYVQPQQLIKCSKTKSQCSVDTLVSDGYIPALPTTYGSVAYYIMFDGDSHVYYLSIQYVGSYVTYLYWGGGIAPRGCMQLYIGYSSFSYNTSTTFNNYTKNTLSQLYYTITLADPPSYNTNYIPIVNRGPSNQTEYTNVYSDSAYLEIPSTAGKVLQTTGNGTAAWGNPNQPAAWTYVTVTTSNYSSVFEVDEDLTLNVEVGVKYYFSTSVLSALSLLQYDMLYIQPYDQNITGGALEFVYLKTINYENFSGYISSAYSNDDGEQPWMSMNVSDMANVLKCGNGGSGIVIYLNANGDLVIDGRTFEI